MDMEKIMLNPERTFKTPEEIADSNELTKAEKIKLLESWAYDIQELEKAEEENMGGNDNYTFLRRIKNLLLELKKP